MLYPMNNSVFAIEPFAEGIVREILFPPAKVRALGFSYNDIITTKILLEGRTEAFVYPTKLELELGQRVRIYRSEQDFVVKLAGIEILSKDGKIIPGKQFNIYGYEFKD